MCINIKLMFTQISQRPAPEDSSSFSVSCNNIFFYNSNTEVVIIIIATLISKCLLGVYSMKWISIVLYKKSCMDLN